MKRISSVCYLVCLSCLAAMPISTAANQYTVERIGRLNPNFDANYPGSISDYSTLFFPAGVLRNGPFDATHGDILIYTTERFVNGQGNLGYEYTQAATNGRQIWNLDTGNGELVGGSFGSVEFDGNFYFRSNYSGLQKSDGIHSQQFAITSPGIQFSDYGGVFKFQDLLLYSDGYREDVSGTNREGLFEVVGDVATPIFATFPDGQPFHTTDHQIRVIDDEILLTPTFNGNMYRVQRESGAWHIDTIQLPATSIASSLFTPLGNNYIFTNHTSASGFEPHVLNGTVASQLADVNPGPASASPHSLTALGNKVIFSALGPNGREPYVTDGTSVQLLADLLPGGGDSDPREFTVAGNLVYFAAIGPEGRQFYVSDGVDVDQVTHFSNPPGGFSPFVPIQTIGDRVYFTHFDASGAKLYAMEGQSMLEIPGMPVGMFFRTELVELNGFHYFVAEGAGGTNKILRTDGVSIESVSDGLPGVPGYIELGLTSLNGSLLFSGGGSGDWALYRLDVVPEPGGLLLACIALAVGQCRPLRRRRIAVL